jgi:hydroxysqualene synthase
MQGVNHYENFPVASLLCPPHLRAPIAAIYWFARTADDMADEGDASSAQRLNDLAAFRADLQACAQGHAFSRRWHGVFSALQRQMQQHALPQQLLGDLLSAFEQDVRYTAAVHWYPDHEELLAYCRFSADPIGRLLLHLYGVHDAASLEQSDAICSALQLINFWQDLSRDVPRGRYYLPRDLMAAHSVQVEHVLDLQDNRHTINLIAACAGISREKMQKGFQLPATVAAHLGGFTGWRAALELHCVIQGGLRILDKMERMGFCVLTKRPKLNAWDAVVVLFKALRQSQP